MKKLALAILAASGLTAATFALAPAATAAPSGTGSAQQTVDQLQAQGHRVILNKVGSESLDQCTVSSGRRRDHAAEPVG
jgi:hypothetical protein